MNTNTLSRNPEINALLSDFVKNMENITDIHVIGVYLYGSLTYGDFNLKNSDIDCLVITEQSLSSDSLLKLRTLHDQLMKKFPTWAHRFECSYLPITLLNTVLPPTEPRPYVNEGVFYDEAPYGNEWIINNYLLYDHGMALIGPNFKSLVNPISITDVQKACIRDLFQEWAPKLSDLGWLDNNHYQSYLVLNLCRILYTVFNAKTGSKKESAAWVKSTIGSQFKTLIETADAWVYGIAMHQRDEAIAFIQFTIDLIKKTSLYQTMSKP